MPFIFIIENIDAFFISRCGDKHFYIIRNVLFHFQIFLNFDLIL